MKFLPIYKTQYVVHMTANECREILAPHIEEMESRSSMRIFQLGKSGAIRTLGHLAGDESLGLLLQTVFRSNKPIFRGEISNTGFKIQRRLSFRNSFNAEITGMFKELNGKTEVFLDAKLMPSILGFVVFYLAIIALFLFDMVFGKGSVAEIVVTLIMVVFVWGLVNGGFWSALPGTLEEIKSILGVK